MIFLSVDVGTSSVKMSILDERLRELDTAKASYPYVLLPGSKVEIEPGKLMAAIYEAAASLDPLLRDQVEMVCYDTFSPSLVCMEESGGLTYRNVITHLDRRSRQQCTYIAEHFGKDRYLRIAGLYPFAGGASAMTLLWLRDNEPECLGLHTGSAI